MATKTEIRNINIVINGKEVKNDIKSIGGEYKKAKNELAKLTIGSDAYNKKVKEVKKLKGVLDEHRKSLGLVQSSWGKLKDGIKSLLPALGIGAMVAGFKSLVSNIITVRSEFEKYEAVLTNSLGSQRQARMAMQQLTEFASKTPFQLNELTAAYVKLVNQGMTPSMKEMTKMGDLASSVGKSFDQLTEAVIDAATGEFERLKEFGIRAKKEGDKVTFTFKGQQQQVDFTSDSIKEYILSLGEMEGVSGSMAAISETLGGRISNLGDSWDTLLNTLGSKSSGIFVGVINWTIKLINNLQLATKTVADLKAEVRDIEASENLIQALEEMEVITASLVRNGMELPKAQEIALKLYRQNLTSTIDTYKSSLETASEAEKASLEQKIELLQDELDMVNDHFKKIEAKAEIAKASSLKLTKEEIKEQQKLKNDYQKAEEKLQNKIRQIREQLQLKSLTEQAREIQAVKFKYAKLEEEAKGHAEELAEIKKLAKQEEEAINKKFADDAVKKRAEVEAKIEEMLLDGKDKEIAVVAKKYQDLIKLAEQFGFDTSDLFAKMNEDIDKIIEGEDKDEDKEFGWIGEILGLTPDQTDVLIESLANLLGITSEQLEDWLEEWDFIDDAILGAIDLTNAFASLRKANEDADLANFEKNQEAKRASLEKQLDSGLISQENFNNQVQQLDDQTERKKTEIARDRAEREKDAAIFDATINGIAAAVRFLVDPGGYAGIALAALAGVTAGIQIAAIQAEPIPAFEHGGRINKEGLILAGEGNKEEGILSNAVLTDPKLGPLANFLLDKQAGIDVPFPTTATATPNFGDLSRAVDFNNFQRSGGGFGQSVTNNNTINTTEPSDNASQQILAEFQKMNEFLADPANRQAYIPYDTLTDFEKEMEYLNRANKF